MTRKGIEKQNLVFNYPKVTIIKLNHDPRHKNVVIYYKTDDNEYNKDINDMYVNWLWYKRSKLEPYSVFREIDECFEEYVRRWLYCIDNTQESREAENERYKRIRKAPII